MSEALVSVIVRAHDPSKINILENALKSLVSQTYQKVEVVLALQNFVGDQAKELDLLLAKHFASSGKTFKVIHLPSSDLDQRSKALNLGLNAASGERVAFLDYDDIMYPDAYERLSSVLDQNPNAALSFGACVASYLRTDSELGTLKESYKERYFLDKASVNRLWQNSFTPIHSFLINRKLLQERGVELLFPEDFCLFEDYAVLLKLSVQAPFDFSLFDQSPVCEYRIPVSSGHSISTLKASKPDLYREQITKVWNLRKQLGLVGLLYWLKRPFYYPFKTKIYRFINRNNRS